MAGGKKGDVCIFDVRQRKQLHTFIVHDSSVRCMALDPCEEFFVTGSAEGDIKVHNVSLTISCLAMFHVLHVHPFCIKHVIMVYLCARYYYVRVQISSFFELVLETATSCKHLLTSM